MTAQARKVLNDCQIALELLEGENDLNKWRVHWVAALALVRAVGHVLYKVDSEGNSKLKTIVSRKFAEWKSNLDEHQIFRDFVEKERNNVLKEYQLGTHPLDNVEILMSMNGYSVDSGEPEILSKIFSIGDNIYRPMVDGYRAGDDGRDVYEDALAWWENQLGAIESELSA